MTFPDKKFASVAEYAGAYFDQGKAAASSVDSETLEAALACLDAAYERGGMVYVCGNGGSASISNHLVCDHSKGGQTDTDLRPKVVSLSTNMEMSTAFTGFDGGRSAKLATNNLHVEGDNYGVVEDTHQSLMHILAQYIRLKRMDDGTIQERKF